MDSLSIACRFRRATSERIPSRLNNQEIKPMSDKTREERDMNRDPITGAPGAHPVGTGVGAAGGAAAGAAIGAAGGPVGAAVGGVVGAVVGGLAGKGVGEAVNPTAEDTYWREAYLNEPYYNSKYGYDDYAPAYRVGYSYTGRTWDDAEDKLRSEWERAKGASRLEWEEAKSAARAGWHRVTRS